ncbi:MAG: hypothetical protein GYA24_07800 [Candidatus Lokiarchaeota archaeon]|nr:hypothetical protein [Candidatus Lokiarchaeota archaeon]
MDEIDECIGAECKALDRARLGWRHRRRTKGMSFEEHCPYEQAPAREYFEED